MVVPVVPVVVVVVVVLILLCRVTVALVGGFNPRVRDLSLLTCKTAISTTTSGRALSRSSTSFSASAIWSGVPRTTSAFCESNCCTRCTSSTARIAFTTSCNSVGCRKIRKIKSLENALFQFLALGRIILRHKNRVCRHRPPESLRFQRRNLQRLFQRHSIQFDLNAPRSVVGIEQHIDPGQLPDGLINHFGIFGELDGDGNVRDGGQFYRTCRFLDLPLQTAGRTCRLRRRIIGLVDHLLRALQFLLRDEERGIDQRRLLKFGQRLLQLALVAQNLHRDGPSSRPP